MIAAVVVKRIQIKGRRDVLNLTKKLMSKLVIMPKSRLKIKKGQWLSG